MNLVYLSCRFVLLALFVSIGFDSIATPAQAQRQRVMTGVRFDGDSMHSPTVVSKIIKGGPADKAGLLIGDELLSVDDTFVVQAFDVTNILKKKNPGDTIRVEVQRGAKFLFFDMVLIDHVKGDKIIQEDGTAVAAPVKPAIQDELGPELRVTQWHNWASEQPPRIRQMKGQVICMLLFQTSCEFSKRYGIPQFKQIYDKYNDDPNVTILAIQTPFHQFEKNTHEKAVAYMDEQEVKFPIGQDGSETRRSHVFDAYRAPGTPWIVIMDKRGIVRFNDTDLPIENASKLIEELKSKGASDSEESSATASEAETPANDSTNSGQ